MEAADEVADHQQDVAALAKRFGERRAGRLAIAAGPVGGRDLLAVIQPDRQQHDQQGESRQRPHGRPPAAELVLQHRRQRHDEELAERAAGRADADRQCRLRRWRHAQDHPQHRPEGRCRQADTDQDVAQDEHGAVMHGGGHDHAQHVERTAASDGRGRAEAIAQPSRERGDGAHQQHGQRGAEGEQLAADMELGRDRLQEDAEALANAQTDGEDEKTAPNGGPV
jgi:hypothetical protein